MKEAFEKLLAENKEMKESFEKMSDKQGRVNVQLNLLNKYIEGTKKYFPIQSMEDLMELEQKMENPGTKAAVETELRRQLKKGDENFLGKIASLEVIDKVNVTGRGKRENLFDFHIFKYSAEVMGLNRSQLRNQVEKQQAKRRQRLRRAQKIASPSSSTQIENTTPTATIGSEIAANPSTIQILDMVSMNTVGSVDSASFETAAYEEYPQI
uniref:Uncharacterized protein n=1 Tax=Phlebotomus papatasi TaxID=29031 RepID=A0A1B0GMW4_PHLPP